jgi:hypothetical protein
MKEKTNVVFVALGALALGAVAAYFFFGKSNKTTEAKDIAEKPPTPATPSDRSDCVSIPSHLPNYEENTEISDSSLFKLFGSLSTSGFNKSMAKRRVRGYFKQIDLLPSDENIVLFKEKIKIYLGGSDGQLPEDWFVKGALRCKNNKSFSFRLN